MKTSIAILFFSILVGVHTADAQYKAFGHYNLGALIARGSASGPAPDLGYFTQGSYTVRSVSPAFVFSFNSGNQEKGFGVGTVFALALGGSSERGMGDDLGGGNSDFNGVWSSDFGLFVDWKIGLAFNYSLPAQEATFGLRYFNWYNGNVFSNTYGGADDMAALGLVLNWKKWGLNYSIGSDKIPGVLVNGHRWNLSELELRYGLKHNEKTKGGMMVGLKWMNQKLVESGTFGLTPNTTGHLISAMLLFY